MKWVNTVLMLLTMTSCQQSTPYTLEYLTEHLHVLESELNFCAQLARPSQSQKEQCATTLKAQQIVREYLRFQQHNQTEFGIHLLQAQMRCAQVQAKLGKAQQPSEQQILKASYNDTLHEIKIMLAVIGLNGPE